MTSTRTRSGKVREMLYEQEYDLKLTVAQLEELEELTGMGSHGILNRFLNQEFRVKHVLEVIRLGLIGSGEMEPRKAAHYVNTYIRDPKDKQGRTYVMDYYPAALKALESSLYGPEDDQPPAGKEGVTTENEWTPTPSPDGVSFIEPLLSSDLVFPSSEA